jgi:DNA-binding IclR family transcriptional regulator
MKQAAAFDLRGLGASSAGPRGVLRLLQVLGHIAEHPQGCTLAQLCVDLAMPKTTLFTLLKTLQACGYLEGLSGVYRLGPSAVTLGASMAASARQRFPDCAAGILEGLCRRTGETAILAVLTADGMNCRYVAVVESGNSLRFTVQRDSLRPSYATGTGHAMLAWLPAAEVEAILQRVKFERITAKTVASRSALLATLKRVRRQHVSTTDSGTVPGVLSIAAPIFDETGRVHAAISVGGPSTRMAPQLESLQRVVRGAADDISRALGYAGEWPA